MLSLCTQQAKLQAHQKVQLRSSQQTAVQQMPSTQRWVLHGATASAQPGSDAMLPRQLTSLLAY